MIYYDSIYVSEEINVNKISKSKQCDVYHYCYFLDKRFKFQMYSDGHDLLMSFSIKNDKLLETCNQNLR